MHARTSLAPAIVVLASIAACTYSVGELATTSLDSAPDGGPASCTDVLRDAKNCGQCGHDCLGQPCDDGFCQPKIVADAQDDLRSIAVDDRSVYWGSGGSGGVWYCTEKNCATVKQLHVEERAVVAIAPTTTHVFWTLGDAILRWAKGTDEIVRVDDSAGSNVDALAANESFFYWTAASDVGGVARCAATGCTQNRTDFVAGYGWPHPTGLALGKAGFVFASGDGDRQIVYCAPTCDEPGGGRSNILAEGQRGAIAFALDDRFAFWTSANAVMRASTAQPFAPTQISAIPSASAIAVDASYVYVVSAGTISKVPKEGGAAIVLAKDLPTARAIAVDDQRVYVANAGPRGTVVWIAK
ncbi:hypothetical protein AKJ09_04594 [Labilithrix luteola]|uniref:Uncharacterized protein n=1 Tax=Labilithrix luteola TaxID=1391654 RepID=A0A0K1PWM3_9BACT|nr:hypothetical protein [Labilithrix luteola]AKU97930.1 hypothetical protein AKJ09_04594 [Labilithrix luteola]